MAPNYVSIDHVPSFQGKAPWVKAIPLADWHLPSPSKQTATVILIHGFANSGGAWFPIAQYLQESLPHVKFILPNAPIIPNHLPGKIVELPSWFDPHLEKGTALAWDAPSSLEDEAGWKKSYDFLEAIVEEEAKIVGKGKVFLGGFSQGTLYATALGLSNENVGGIIALAARISWRDSLSKIPSNSVQEKAVFWGHGLADPLAAAEFGEKSVEWLTETFGLKRIPKTDAPAKGTVIFSTYPGLAHFTNEEEVEDVKDWLKALLPN